MEPKLLRLVIIISTSPGCTLEATKLQGSEEGLLISTSVHNPYCILRYCRRLQTPQCLLCWRLLWRLWEIQMIEAKITSNNECHRCHQDRDNEDCDQFQEPNQKNSWHSEVKLLHFSPRHEDSVNTFLSLLSRLQLWTNISQLSRQIANLHDHLINTIFRRCSNGNWRML